MIKKSSKLEIIITFIFGLGLIGIGIIEVISKTYFSGFLFIIAGLVVLAMEINILILEKERDALHAKSETKQNGGKNNGM